MMFLKTTMKKEESEEKKTTGQLLDLWIGQTQRLWLVHGHAQTLEVKVPTNPPKVRFRRRGQSGLI